MSSVSWNFNLVVLNDVLFDYGVAILQRRGLIYSFLVVIGLGDEAIVPRDMSRHFSRSHCEIMMFVSLRLCLFW